MFTRLVSLTFKPGQAKQALELINETVLPMLGKQVGFMDASIFVSTNDPNRALAQSFWYSQEDVERFNRDQYPKIREMMKNMLLFPPGVETYEVTASTIHRITSRKAA